MSRMLDATIVNVDEAMKMLRGSVRGIPVKAGAFRMMHQKMTRDMAYLVVLLDSARPRFPGGGKGK